MIPVYARDPDRLRSISTLLSVDHERYLEWTCFARRAAGAEVAIVSVQAPHSEEVFSSLKRLNARHATGIVPILEEGVTHEPLPTDAGSFHVVRYSEAPWKLAVAIGATKSEMWRCRVAAAFEASERVPPLVKEAIACAYLSPVSPRSVQAIARAVGTHPSALAHRWRAYHPGSIRFQDLLHWLRLDWACLYRPRYRDWLEAADHLGVSEPTLRRIAMGRTGRPLGQLAQQGRRQLHRMFDDEILGPLLGRRIEHA